MPTQEQLSWTLTFTGIDLGAVVGAVKTTMQSLPGSAMLPDCKPVKGKVPGPAQHLLCATHGHILDIKEKKIIAVSLAQYKSQKIGSAKPPQAAPPAQAAPPPAAVAPAPAAPAGAATSADADAAKMQAQATRLLNQMQVEAEDIASVRSQYEELAGGGRVNRAVSWISDKLGGADDPSDDLAEIAGQIAFEEMSGIAAVGQNDLDAAHKHLATMQTLNKKAHVLWLKYSSDTGAGAGRAVTGLEVASKAGDVATMGLNVVAPGAGKVLSVVKNVSVTGSKLHFDEKVNWTEFTVDMAFDLFVGGEGGKVDKLAKKLSGPLIKAIGPKLSAAIAKKFGKDVSEEIIKEYTEHATEEALKYYAKDIVMPLAEKAVEKPEDITHGQLVDQMLDSMTNPSGQLALRVSEMVMANFTL